jgi:hypothetical protein
MSEQKPEKKVVSRTMAISLGIICIILMVGLVGAIVEISSLNSKVNDLNSIVNCSKQETWFSNETLTINPNENVSKQFNAPLSGNARVVGYVQSRLVPSDVWTNLTWWVEYGTNFISPYHVSPTPHVDYWSSNYFEEEYPIVSFAPIQPLKIPTVLFVIGNSGAAPVTVNLTITFTY